MADGGSPTYQGVGRGRGRARQPAVPNGQVIASKRTLGQSYGRSDFSVPPGPLEAHERVNHIQVSEGVSALPRGVPIMRSADGLNEHANATKSEITSILTSEYVTMVRRLETLDAIYAEKSSLMIQLNQTTAWAASLEAENYQLRSTLKESSTRLDEELRHRVVTLHQHNLSEPDDGVSNYASAIGSEEKSEFLYEKSSLEMTSQGDGNSNQQLRRENEILRRQVQSLQRQSDSVRREANLKFNRLRQEKDQLQNQFSLIDSHLVRESNLRKALEDELERHFSMQKQNGLLKQHVQQQTAIINRSSKTRYSPMGNHHQTVSTTSTGPAQHPLYPLPINSSKVAFWPSSACSNGSMAIDGHAAAPIYQQWVSPPPPSGKKKKSGGAGAKERNHFNKKMKAISEGRGESGPWGPGEQLVYPRWPQTDDQDRAIVGSTASSLP